MTHRERDTQLTALQELWNRDVTPALAPLDTESNLFRLLFARGFAQLGANNRAASLSAEVRNELDYFDERSERTSDPSATLFRLYLARMSVDQRHDSDAQWATEVRDIYQRITGPRVLERVEPFRKRSRWLRFEPSLPTQPSWSNANLRELVLEGQSHPERMSHILKTLHETPDTPEAERAEIIERFVTLALAELNHEHLSTLAMAALEYARQIETAPLRCEALTSVSKCAHALRSRSLIEAILQSVQELILTTHTMGGRELVALMSELCAAMATVAPEHIEPLIAQVLAHHSLTERDKLLLHAVRARTSQRDDGIQSLQLITHGTTTGAFAVHERFELAMAAVASAERFSVDVRRAVVATLVKQLSLFALTSRLRDAFTTCRFFSTYRLLLMEQIIDCILAPATP